MKSMTKENLAGLERLGRAFASIREKMGVTQTELASATCLHVNTISNIERGISEPTIFTLGLLCLALRCPRIHLDEYGFVPYHEASFSPPPKDFRELLWLPGAVMVHSANFNSRRLKAGLSLRELSGMAQVHPNTIWNFEHAQAAPSATAAFRLYRALGVTSIGANEGVLN
jgi:transcriptional regulator with XRE-family HTH domain